MDIQALVLTLKLASVTVALLLLVALPLSYWIVFGASRVRHVVDAVTTLPILLPPTVLGFYILVLLGPRTAIGRSYIHLTGHPLAFSFSGLVIGSMIYSLPFAVQPIQAGFAAIPAGMLEAATLLGSSRFRTLTRVMLPLARRSVFTATILSFTHTVGEFGVVLMIGGDIPGVTRTLSISIFDQVQDFSYRQANRTALLLLAVSLTALVMVYARGRGNSHG
jgi:molybdate transport system permease protein